MLALPQGTTKFKCAVCNTVAQIPAQAAAPSPAPAGYAGAPTGNEFPHGWEECTAPDGRTYYINHNTGETTWIDPRTNPSTTAASTAASPHHLPPYICLVETTEAKTVAEFKAEFGRFIEAGYEGIMLRNKGGMYRCNYRSHDLQKYKEFEEDEFRITGFTQGDGRDKGTVIWVCETKEGKEFTVRPRGTMESRRKLFETGQKYVGKMLTVIYQELTEEGKPRFPVGKDVRDKY